MSEPRHALSLYSRSYCHLCEAMLQALQATFGERYILDVQVIDIDLAPNVAWLAEYDEWVPVLTGHRAGVEARLCHYHLDAGRVAAWLAG